MAITTAKKATLKTSKKTSSKTSQKSAAAPATTTKRAAAPSARKTSNDVLGLSLKPWTASLRRAKGADVRGGKRGFFFALGNRDAKLARKLLTPHLHRWQLQSALESEAESLFFQGSQGPVWIARTPVSKSAPTAAGLEKSSYARFRDLGGAVILQLAAYQPEKLILEMHGLTIEEEESIIVGFELASYSFQENRGGKPKRRLPELLLKEGALTDVELARASELGLALNIARHYVNVPADALNPRTYAESIEELFAGSDTVEVEVWQGERLVKERMNLLLAVGSAAAEGPRLVHMRYRPKDGEGKQPIAIVGKGITFDSGGLDIKPASGMRWMKKDMGGSAAAVAICKWAESTTLPLALDVYVSLAENAVGSRSFRPGDVITARSGMTVEIGNTDAEGRLVLADALDVAVNAEGEDRPAMVINLATLTGAIKVALGAEVAGLFSNSDHLSSVLFDSGLARGDWMWRMPLFQPYRSQLKSAFADCNNCSEGGFGGAITAALFLESFVKGLPWAHLDIYAWRDSGAGAWSEQGGSGQPVQALAEALTRLASEGGGQELG